MTYRQVFEAIYNRLKTAPYSVHDHYDPTLKRPCLTLEAHPAKSKQLGRYGWQNQMNFVVTFLPTLDERHNVKDQREVMDFVDEVLRLFAQPVPGIDCSVLPDGNAIDEAYVQLTAEFVYSAEMQEEQMEKMESFGLSISRKE